MGVASLGVYGIVTPGANGVAERDDGMNGVVPALVAGSLEVTRVTASSSVVDATAMAAPHVAHLMSASPAARPHRGHITGRALSKSHPGRVQCYLARHDAGRKNQPL